MKLEILVHIENMIEDILYDARDDALSLGIAEGSLQHSSDERDCRGMKAMQWRTSIVCVLPDEVWP